MRRLWILFAVALLLIPVASCGGDDDDDDDEKEPTPVNGTFVGKLADTDALIAVAGLPPAKDADRRQVNSFVCDGRRTCEWFPGTAPSNTFTAQSADEDAEAKGELSGEAAKGTIELGDDEPVEYQLSQATATSGLYELTFSRNGKIRGASAAGVALTGNSTLPDAGSGTLKLADGTRLRLEITTGSAEGDLGLRPGQIRLIVLPDRTLAGAARARGGGEILFVRSSK
jgi:hypothetical protein